MRYFVLLLSLLSILVGVLFIIDLRKEQADYHAKLESSVQQTLNYVRQNIDTAIATGNTIFSSRWLTHYRDVSGIYNDEFDILVKKEICSDLFAKTIALEAVTDILIITPKMDSVISTGGWFSIEQFARFYKHVQIRISDTLENNLVINATDPKVCILELTDYNIRQDKTTICLVIDKQAFAAFMGQIKSESMAYVQILLDEQVLYETGAYNDRQTIRKADQQTRNIRLTIGSPSFHDAHMQGFIIQYSLLLLIMLLLSTILAYFLTHITLRPLRQIINKYLRNDLSAQYDPYQSVTQYVDAVARKNTDLSEQNVALSKSIQNYLSIMKDDLLASMLTNQDFDFQDEYICSIIPWINEGLPYLLIVFETKTGQTEVDSASFIRQLKQTGHVHDLITFKIIGETSIWLIWLDKDVNSELEDEIVSQIEYFFAESAYYALSPLLSQPEEMHAAFLSLKAELNDLISGTNSLPISLQISFLKGLQSDKCEQCLKIIKKSVPVYEPDAFFKLLIRSTDEFNVDISEQMLEYQQYRQSVRPDLQWSLLQKMTRIICEAATTHVPSETNHTATAICHYVKDHFNDPNMSVKLLANHFSMHRTLISKSIKSDTGISFSDYLLDLRMKQTVALFQKPEVSITAVAEKVGYINYSTFKRSFIKYFGVSPREYRNK